MTQSLYEPNSRKWAEEVFSGVDLGDPRRDARLIDYAARQAEFPDASTASVCRDSASAEGAYRLLRNDYVEASDIDAAVFENTAARLAEFDCVLAIQDTTSTAAKSRKVAQRTDFGSSDGFQVHTCLAVNAVDGMPIGLLDQQRWMRSPSRKKVRDKGKATKRSDYIERESYRWEQCHRHIIGLTENQDNIVSVSDRDADIYDYVCFMRNHDQRFVQRACYDRKVTSGAGTIRDALARTALLGCENVQIQQRGPVATGHIRNLRPGRKARVAKVEIRTAGVAMCRPALRSDLPETIDVNVVWVREPNPPKGQRPLDWLLLTSETVATEGEAKAVIGFYEKRWLIEQFHQTWKSGCKIEKRAFESADNLNRMYAITAPIAVRILQLHAVQNQSDVSCEEIMTKEEWHCLHLCAEPGNKIPKRPPSAKWAARSIAKLAGWRDTKATGRIGWTTLWTGWGRFQQTLLGFKMARTLPENL